MVESRRLAYLDALGIPQFVARENIEGAPTLPELADDQIWALQDEPLERAQPVEVVPSPAVEEAQPSREPEISEPIQADSNADVPLQQNSVPPQLDVSKLGLDQERVKPVAGTPAAGKPVQSVERFSLAIVTVPEQFRFIVQLGVADAPGLSAAEYRMLSDILQALGYPNWLNQNAAQSFQWPIVNNPRIAKDRTAARDGLVGFFSSAPTLAKNVFLGVSAASILYQGELDPLAKPMEPVQLDGLPGQSLILPSFLQMQDWQLKPRAWQQMQKFLK